MTAQYVQLFSFGTIAATDPFAVAKRLADMGFAGVEPVLSTGASPELIEWSKTIGAPELAPTDVPLLKRALDEHGLTAPSAHASLPTGDEGERLLDELALLGTTFLIVAAMVDSASAGLVMFDGLDQIKDLADRFASAAERAATRGITIGYHNHFWEFGADFDGQNGLELFYDLTAPSVVAEVDVYWAQLGGQDPVDLVRRLGDRVKLLHVKDGDGQFGTPSCALGEGTVDLPAVLAAAPDAQRVIELENLSEDALWDTLGKSFAYLESSDITR